MISENPNFKAYFNDDGSQLTLETVCPYCKKKQTLVLTGERIDEYRKGCKAYEDGWKLQDAFPTFSREERELVFTGICPECNDEH